MAPALAIWAGALASGSAPQPEVNVRAKLLAIKMPVNMLILRRYMTDDDTTGE